MGPPLNAETLAMRIISAYGKINNNHLISAKLDYDEWSRVTGTILQLQEQNFSISDNPSLSLQEIGNQIADFCKSNDDALIIIDDIQRIKPKKSLEGKMTRSDELTEISRYLKEIAQTFQIPIVVVSQLNRNLENRPNKRPVISDLRDCGAIEDNADLILFIYRDEVYNKESKEAGTAEIIIGKQRNGATGTVRLAFEGQYTRFSNLSPEYYAQYEDEE